MSELKVKADQWAANIIQALDSGSYSGGWFKKDARKEYVAEMLLLFSSEEARDD